MVTLRILNETGHTELELMASEVIEQINDHPSYWVSVDGDIIDRRDIPTMNWDTVQNVDLIPAIVGG
jgi:sulfur carrier protein ThiS|tara:strand:+ start:167 stop:367 length:201 start_codon:yes stop_codon:yes gene_type:complete